MTAVPAPTSATAGRFADPAARNYLAAGLGALLVAAAAMLAKPDGGLLAAILPAAVGALGLVGRLTVMPVVYLLLLGYLLVFPSVVPAADLAADDTVTRSHFRLSDLVLACSVLIYFVAQFRLLGLTDRAVPPDGPARKGRLTGIAPRRTGSAEGEFERLFAVAAACVVAGQVAWFVVAEFQVDLRGRPPVVSRWAADGFFVWESTSRFLILAGIVGVVGGGAGLAFWYGRLVGFTPAEGRMVLIDTQWRESRRELDRQEWWRAWAVNRRRRRAVAAAATATRPRRWAVAVVVVGVALGVAAFLLLVGFVVVAYAL